jgi:hypothetical protein
MLDEFTRQNRIEAVNSLKESIVNLESSHATLEVTSQIFKESIAKEKALFGLVLEMEVTPPSTPLSQDNTAEMPTDVGIAIAESVVPVKSYQKQKESLSEPEDSEGIEGIEGIMSTETVPTITSK